MPDVLDTAADVNGKVQIQILFNNILYSSCNGKSLFCSEKVISDSHTPVICSWQESSHGGDLGPPRTPSFSSCLTPICGGVGGYAYQVPLNAVQHLAYKLANVLAQSLDQTAEEIASPC